MSSSKFGNKSYPVLGTLARANDRDRIMFISAAGLAFFLLLFVMIAIQFKKASAKEANVASTSAPAPAAMGSITLLSPEKFVRAGTKLSDISFKEVYWPRNQVPEGAVRDLAELTDFYAKADIQPGVPIQRSQMSSERPGITLPLTPGNRAVSIEVDATGGLEGHALPGTRVDVVLTHKNDGELTSKIIVENARVLSYGGDTTPGNNVESRAGARTLGKTLTLDVSPQDALKIATSREMGRLSLLMRSADDNKASPEIEMDRKKIEGGSAKASKKDSSCQRGTARMNGKEYVVDCDGSLHLVESNEP